MDCLAVFSRKHIDKLQKSFRKIALVKMMFPDDSVSRGLVAAKNAFQQQFPDSHEPVSSATISKLFYHLDCPLATISMTRLKEPQMQVEQKGELMSAVPG